MLGTANLKKIVSVAVELGDVALELKSMDNVFDRAKALMGLVDEAMYLINLDLAALKAEWADLDEKERADLSAHFVAEFDITDDKVEGLVEKSFEAILLVAKSVEKLVTLSKSYA